MTGQWVKKIVGSADVPPGELAANDKNFRVHPPAQRDALLGAIGDIGFIRSVTVNKRTDRILDGHLRVALALETGQLTIPVEYVDLTEEEAEALATIDPLAALAETNREKLDALLREVRARSPAVTAMLARLAKMNGLGVSASEQEAAETTQVPEKFEVVVEFSGEQDQRELYERLTAEGRKCRVLSL